MRVKLRTRMAGPAGCVAPGEERELPDEMARALIEAGSAVAVSSPAVKAAEKQEQPPESAAAEPEESAMLTPPRRRRKV